VWIYGNGGHAKVVRDIIKSHWVRPYMEYPVDEIIIDDADPKKPWRDGYSQMSGIIAVGDNKSRKRIADRLNHAKYLVAKASSATFQDGVFIGLGTVLMHGSHVNADAFVDRHSIINTGATVDHDCRLSAFTHIAPGAHLCGNVKVGEGTLVGAGTIVTPGVSIGPWLVIPAGSVVTKDCMNEDDVAEIRKR
jgi:sugar O-acyltransferase (sialic acid O-acetyltransferase NeuD family)